VADSSLLSSEQGGISTDAEKVRSKSIVIGPRIARLHRQELNVHILLRLSIADPPVVAFVNSRYQPFGKSMRFACLTPALLSGEVRHVSQKD
jgi:hypothetical protein